MSSLAHHGVKGQKWGVRRYQNQDGTRTDRGKKQDKLRRLRKNTSEDFISIRKTLSDDDLRMLNYSDKAIKYMRKNGSLNNDPITSGTAHRVIQKDKNGTPVTYVEATGFTSNSLLTGKETVRIISIDLATRSGEEYRGKGHAVAAGKKMVRWFDRYGYKEYEYMEWAAKEKNIASQKTAEKLGFNKLDISEPGWTLYAYAKHSSITEDNSYLSHHGILGMKWGVRRFQRLDGSLTPAGLERKKKLIELGEKRVKQEVGTGDSTRGKVSSELSKHGIVADGSDTDILKKGSIINRYANQNEPLDSKRKYFSITPADKMEYGYSLSHLPIQGKAALFEYQVDRDLKIANGKKIESIIAAHFRDEANNASIDKKQRDRAKRIIEAINEREENAKLTLGYYETDRDRFFNKDSEHSKYKKIDRKIGMAAEDKNILYNDTIDQYSEAFSGKLHNKELVKALQKEGYDGYIDMFDAKTVSNPYSNYEYPLVILNPKDKMRLKRKTAIHSSIGGNMNYIYGNTLVLGDSSYLEHHGIKNQKWGIRRFQNPDGSLTAAGRIRYSVTGAAKAAFKVGKKLGAATASAARAGMKKAKDNSYEKKKEKASQTREGVLKNKKMFTNEELKRLEERFKIEDDMRNAGLRHGQEIAKTISAYSDAAVKTMNALQTGGKAVKAISDGLSALQDYKEKRDIGKKASDAGMSTADYKEYTKAKTSEKTSNKPPNDDNPPNNGGGGGSKKQAEYEAKRQAAQEATYAKRKADLDSRESGLKQREDYVNKRYDALLKVSKQRQSEQDARDEDLNRRDKSASERESKLKETAKIAADVMSKLKKRQADLDKKESFLNSIESYRLDTLSEFKKNEEEAARRKKKNAKHSAIGEEMYTDHLEHHGIKGQKWGVRRFQNPDGSLTDKGRKHYQKKLALEERKLTAANAARGKYERVRTPLSVGMAVIGAVAGGMAGTPAGPAGIAAGAAFVSAIAGSSTYAEYTLKGVFAGHGANRSKKKIAKYKEALSQDAFEIQNGVLIYGSDQSGELEHFGLKGMKWGVRRFQNKDGSLTDAGKQRYSNTGELDGGGGGAEEEDEETKKKIEEAAKKAGMTVEEYRKKFADKVTALKEKARDAAWDARYAAEDAADAVTGKTSKEIAEKSAKSAKENEEKAKAAKYEEWAKQSREISEYRQKKYDDSLAGRVEATSRKIGTKAQEAKDKLKSRAPKRSIALEVANTGPVPVGQTEIHTADLYNKYFGAVARARKTAANSTAAQRAKYGDRRNIRERAEAEELNNARAREKRDEAIRLRMAKKFDKKADSARAHGNTAKAKAFEKESNRQFNKAPISGSKAEAFEAARDATLANHLVRNAATAKRAQSATLAENRNRNAAHLSERRRERSINEAKAKIRSGKLPVNELTRYAKSSVGQLKSAAKAELARREREQALTSMGSDYARATARVTTTSSTTNTTDAHNEKLARDRRDKRKQAARASATAKKNRLAGSGRKKYTSGQTSSIGRVGSGRGKTSTRR